MTPEPEVPERQWEVRRRRGYGLSHEVALLMRLDRARLLLVVNGALDAVADRKIQAHIRWRLEQLDLLKGGPA